MAILTDNFKWIKSLLLFFLLGFISCTEKGKDLFDPTLESTIEFSLSDKTYRIEDIIKRQAQISVDSGKYLLRFSTDEIAKDTILDVFKAGFFEMAYDTVFYVFFSDTINAQMIIRRDSVGIEEAELASGVFRIAYTNYTNKNALMEITLPGFTRRIGNTVDTIKLGGTIPPLQTVIYEKDISGFIYKQPSNQPQGTTQPGFWIKGTIAVQNGSWGDSIRADADIRDIKFYRMRGRFKPLDMGVKGQTFKNALSADISEFISRVTFDSINVKIVAKTAIDYPVRLKNFQVFGIFKDGRVPINLRFGDLTSLDTLISRNGKIDLIFNNLNTNANYFLSQLPDSINVTTVFILNPNFESGEVKSNDTVSYSFKIDAWSRFTVDSADWTDTFELDISNDVRDKIKRADEGSIIIHSTNEIPFEVQFVGIVTDSFYNPLFYLTRNAFVGSDSVIFLNGALTNSSGNVISPSYQSIKTDLNQVDLEKLSRGGYLIQKFILSTTNKQIGEVTAKQKINLRIAGKIKLNLTSDDF